MRATQIKFGCYKAKYSLLDRKDTKKTSVEEMSEWDYKSACSLKVTRPANLSTVFFGAGATHELVNTAPHCSLLMQPSQY